MTISAAAQKATATIASSRFMTEQKMIEAIQGAIDTEAAPLLTEIAGLKQEINAIQAAAQQQQLKFNEELTAARQAQALAQPAPTVASVASNG